MCIKICYLCSGNYKLHRIQDAFKVFRASVVKRVLFLSSLDIGYKMKQFF